MGRQYGGTILKEKGSWTQFVRNQFHHILKDSKAKWLYVPKKENPSDLGTRGVSPEKLSSLWFNGPIWLKQKGKWPDQLGIAETLHASCESINVKENIYMVTEKMKEHVFKELWNFKGFIFHKKLYSQLSK